MVMKSTFSQITSVCMLQPKLKSYPLPVNNCFGPFVAGPQGDAEEFSKPVALVFLKIAKLLHKKV